MCTLSLCVTNQTSMILEGKMSWAVSKVVALRRWLLKQVRLYFSILPDHSIANLTAESSDH